MTAQHPAAPEGETDATGWVDVLRAHLVRDRWREDGEAIGTYCTCGNWEGDYFADGEPGPFDLHLAEVIERIVAERLRVVEGERDAARAEMLDGMLAAGHDLEQAWARAESAEAAHAALVAGVEALGDEPVAPYPAECSCSHGMGFQFHAYPCRYSREVPRSAVSALLAGGGA